MDGVIYLAVAWGCFDAGWGFRKSLAWPYHLGRLIARHTTGGTDDRT